MQVESERKRNLNQCTREMCFSPSAAYDTNLNLLLIYFSSSYKLLLLSFVNSVVTISTTLTTFTINT